MGRGCIPRSDEDTYQLGEEGHANKRKRAALDKGASMIPLLYISTELTPL